MKFEEYVNKEDVWINFDLNNPFLNEEVLYVSSQSYIDILEDINVESRAMDCETNEDFIKMLNDLYKTRNVEFVYKSLIGNIKAKTNVKTGKITVFVNHNLLLLYNTKREKLKKELKILFDHDLVHREQAKRVNFSSYKHTNYDKISKKYFSNKQEIMAYANTIVNQLFKKFYFDNKVLNFLRKPDKNVSNLLDRYINNFDKNSKTIKRLYKYMYEYIIKGYIDK